MNHWLLGGEREYIITFGNATNSLTMPRGLAVNYRCRRKLKEGDKIVGGFQKPPPEIAVDVANFLNRHPKIAQAQYFEIIGLTGEHIIFVIPH